MAQKINTKVPNGFSKLSREERLQFLRDENLLDEQDYMRLLNNVSPSLDLAESFIENVIGYFHIPLGILPELIIDDVCKTIPMAVEETSIIAAASRTAKWINQEGELTSEVVGREIIGQIQMARVQSVEKVEAAFKEKKSRWIQFSNDLVPGLVARGGGVSDIRLRILNRDDSLEKMIVFHVLCDPCDAMGANLINQVCEGLRPIIEQDTGEKVHMCILSNLVDTKITRVQIVLPGIESQLGEGIEEASYFAHLDPYRAATNNKGVLNGIDAVLLATGNDWRAVEAGIHAYAAKQGQYRSVTKWKMQGSDLVGIFEAPVIVGTVGGMTKLHPTAQMALKILKINSANELSQVAAAVGLVQNLGALKALSTVGIVEGHMKLHAANLALAAGANNEEIAQILVRLQECLKEKKRITLSEATQILEDYRRGDHEVSTLSPR